MSVVTWVCDICHSEMQKIQVGTNMNKVYCPNCGFECYIDDNDKYIDVYIHE